MNRALDRKPAASPVFRRRRASTARPSRRDPRSLDASLTAGPCLARVIVEALPFPLSDRAEGKRAAQSRYQSMGETTGTVGHPRRKTTPAPQARRVTRGPRLVAQLAQSAALGFGEFGCRASSRLTVLRVTGSWGDGWTTVRRDARRCPRRRRGKRRCDVLRVLAYVLPTR
jgi:hypothetical protein